MSVQSFNVTADTKISSSQENWERWLDETNASRRGKPEDS